MNRIKNTLKFIFSGLFPVIVFLCPNAVLGQKNYLIQYSKLDADAGLIDRNHRDIYQDPLGYVWILSLNKLYRYDGVECKDFSNRIYKATGRNQLEGIRFLGRNDEKLIIVIASNVVELDLKSNKVRNLFSVRQSDSFLRIINVTEDNSHYWVVLSNGVVQVFDKQFRPQRQFSIQNKKFLKYSSTRIVDGYLFYSYFNELNVYDQNGRMLFNLFNKEIEINNKKYRIKNLNDSKRELVLQQGNQLYKAPFRIVNSVLQFGHPESFDAEKEKNIATLDNGNKVFLPGKDILVENKDGSITSLRSQLVRLFGDNFTYNFISQTRDGVIWIFTSYSYLLLKINNYPFKSYFALDNEKNQIINNSIRSIVADDRGRLWASGYDNFRVRNIDTTSGRTEVCDHNFLGTSLYRMKQVGNEIFGLSELGYMVALQLNGNCSPRNILDLPLTGMIFYDFLFVGADSIWLATSNGLLKFRYDSGVLVRSAIPFSKVPNTRVNGFSKYHNDSIYVATANGVYLLDAQGKILSTYNSSTSAAIRIPDCLVYHVFRTGELLWASTDKGLFKINLNTKKATVYDQTAGLPDNNVYTTLSDPKGYLWLATNKGICRFDPEDQSIQNYSTAQGLPNDEFNNAAYFKSNTGTMYFGGLNGITVINPYLFGIQPKDKSNVYIESYKYSDNGQTYDTLLYKRRITEPFRLTPDFNRLSFTFFMPYFYKSDSHKYRYRIRNIDSTKWILAKDNVISFNYLPPGRYDLEVQGLRVNQGWSRNSLYFTIIIEKYWYQTFTFYLILSLAFIGIVLALYKMRIDKYKNLVSIRSNISSDIHDEIGSTMSSISLYTQALIMNTEDPKKKEILGKIRDNAQSVQESLGDIIWSVRPTMDTYNALFTKMRRFALEISEPKDIKCHFDFAESLSLRRINMDRRRQIYLFYKEVINNAIKHSGCENLYLSFRQERTTKRLVIRDDGRGFDENEVEKGNGLTNMRRRASDMHGDLRISSRPGGGTVISLSF